MLGIRGGGEVAPYLLVFSTTGDLGDRGESFCSSKRWGSGQQRGERKLSSLQCSESRLMRRGCPDLSQSEPSAVSSTPCMWASHAV